MQNHHPLPVQEVPDPPTPHPEPEGDPPPTAGEEAAYSLRHGESNGARSALEQPPRVAPVAPRLQAAGETWWAAYHDATRAFVLPVVGFDDAGMPYVWNAKTHRPTVAVRSEFIGLVSDSYRGEFGDAIGQAIKNANKGHRGEAPTSPAGADQHGTGQNSSMIENGIEKARDIIHEAT